jgi:hypothetical protein
MITKKYNYNIFFLFFNFMLPGTRWMRFCLITALKYKYCFNFVFLFYVARDEMDEDFPDDRPSGL